MDDIVELEIKLAFQEKRIGELDALVRALADRLAVAERDLISVKRAIEPEPVNEPPPHY